MRYWWINANPERDEVGKMPWSWLTNIEEDGVEQFLAEGTKVCKNGDLKLKANFKEVKRGDLVLCYNTNTEKKIVARGVIMNRLHTILPSGEKVIDIKKIKDLAVPVSLYDIIELPLLHTKLTKPRALWATILSLTEMEYNAINNLIDKRCSN